MAINVRMDDKLKKEAEAVFRSVGINSTSAAITMFFTETVKRGTIPFEFDSSVTEQKPAVVSSDLSGLCKEAEKVCEEIGIPMELALSLFLKSVIRRKRLPAELTALLTDKEDGIKKI